MPRKTEDIQPDTTDRPDGLREGVMSDPTGVEMGVITDATQNVFGRPKNPFPMNHTGKKREMKDKT